MCQFVRASFILATTTLDILYFHTRYPYTRYTLFSYSLLLHSIYSIFILATPTLDILYFHTRYPYTRYTLFSHSLPLHSIYSIFTLATPTLCTYPDILINTHYRTPTLDILYIHLSSQLIFNEKGELENLEKSFHDTREGITTRNKLVCGAARSRTIEVIGERLNCSSIHDSKVGSNRGFI